MEKIEKALRELFDDMSLEDKIAIHNKYCKLNHYTEVIAPMAVFDMMNVNMFNGLSASDVILKVQRNCEEFDFSDNYFYWNDNDEIKSFSSDMKLETDVFFRNDVINYIISNEDALGNDEIEELLEEGGLE